MAETPYWPPFRAPDQPLPTPKQPEPKPERPPRTDRPPPKPEERHPWNEPMDGVDIDAVHRKRGASSRRCRMVSFLQDFESPEFDEAHPTQPVYSPSQLRALIAAAYPPEGQLPPCVGPQRLIFDDEAIPAGARIVHSGLCGSKNAVIVEMPPRKSGSGTRTVPKCPALSRRP